MRYIVLLIAFTLFTATAVQAQVETAAKQAIIIDFDTGTVLLEKNADARMPTSSMSKVMTMYMVFDALKAGTINMDDTFLVSEKAWRKGGSKMFVDINTRVALEDLIRGVIVQSGNDATIVLAEGLSGTEDAFAYAMTAKAKELGMESSNFTNASGWPDPLHYSTASDLAILGTRIIKDFPDYYAIYSEKEFTYNKIAQNNRNPLLFRNMGADGIKTGHTQDAGYGLIGSGVSPEGRRVILVVNGLESEAERAQESARLMEWALQGFSNKTVYIAGQSITEARVVYGKQGSVPLEPKNDVVLTLPKISSTNVKVEAVYNSPLIAPIAKGDQVGMLHVTVPGRDHVQEIPLLAAQDIQAQGFFAKTIAKVKQFFAGTV